MSFAGSMAQSFVNVGQMPAAVHLHPLGATNSSLAMMYGMYHTGVNPTVAGAVPPFGHLPAAATGDVAGDAATFAQFLNAHAAMPPGGGLSTSSALANGTPTRGAALACGGTAPSASAAGTSNGGMLTPGVGLSPSASTVISTAGFGMYVPSVPVTPAAVADANAPMDIVDSSAAVALPGTPGAAPSAAAGASAFGTLNCGMLTPAPGVGFSPRASASIPGSVASTNAPMDIADTSGADTTLGTPGAVPTFAVAATTPSVAVALNGGVRTPRVGSSQSTRASTPTAATYVADANVPMDMADASVADTTPGTPAGAAPTSEAVPSGAGTLNGGIPSSAVLPTADAAVAPTAVADANAPMEIADTSVAAATPGAGNTAVTETEDTAPHSGSFM